MNVRLWLRRGFVAVVVVTILAAFLTERLFVSPAAPAVSSVDAVVVLSGDFGDRMERALSLMSKHVAPVLVHAGTLDTAADVQLCGDRDRSFEAVCLFPKPDNTRSEARAVGELARRRHWKSIAVVTSKFHATRAGIEFRRCVDAHVTVVPTRSRAGRRFELKQIPREWLKVIYLQVLHRRC